MSSEKARSGMADNRRVAAPGDLFEQAFMGIPHAWGWMCGRCGVTVRDLDTEEQATRGHAEHKETCE